MLTKRIIPCLDVTEGRVVKGTKFVDLVDAGDAVELAKRYDEEGADELTFLDITASSDKRYILKELVERTANQIFIPFTVGGGIGNITTIRDILNAGADKVSINTAAVKNPELIQKSSSRFGNQCIVVAIDAKRIKEKKEQLASHTVFSAANKDLKEIMLNGTSIWEVYIHGGRTPTSLDAFKWAKYVEELGAGEILLTSMDKDGTKSGYDIQLTATLANELTIPVIASGGAGTTQHICDALKICDAALLASLLHFKELTIKEIKEACKSAGLPIRN